MAIQTTSNLTNAVGARYTTKYQRAAELARFYDQLAIPVSAPQFELEKRRGMGSSYVFNFLSDMTPGATAISETGDIVPQILRDATSSITPTSRGEALKWSELIDLEAYTDFVAARAEILGRNWMETVDKMAEHAALQGNLVVRPVARASLDAGTSTHVLNSSNFSQAATMVQTLRCPPMMVGGQKRYMALAHPDVMYDLVNSGNLLSVALYQDKEMLLNGEIGQYNGFKIVTSPWAKVFLGAGAANGSSASTTLSATANALATTMGVSSSTNISVGRTLMVGTVETANTHYDTNEAVKYVSGTTTVTFVGTGANGGLRFDHASGDTVNNSDNVYPVAFGSIGSLVKVFAQETGEYGELVGPKKDGLADQWTSLAYKWYGGYGRVAENYILRGEYASSLQA